MLPIVAIFFILQAVGAGKALLDWIGHIAEVDEEAQIEQVEGWRKVVRNWYHEGTTRVEKVGKRYGILGYEKVEKDEDRPTSSLSTATNGGDSTVSVGSSQQIRGPGAEQIANAISAYIIVKVSV